MALSEELKLFIIMGPITVAKIFFYLENVTEINIGLKASKEL